MNLKDADYVKLTHHGVPTLRPVHAANGVRYFAHRIEANGCYARKLVITAMPDYNDSCPKILGTLVVTPIQTCTAIEWIEVIGERRRQGIRREMWKLAERLLGYELVHNPVTDLGEKFADSFE